MNKSNSSSSELLRILKMLTDEPSNKLIESCDSHIISVAEDTFGPTLETSTPLSECYERLSRPDVCRCCLAGAGTKDLLDPYSDEEGSQVLLTMLKDCLKITLSNISEGGPRWLVCKKCAETLYSVHLFKQQVIAAEKTFVKYYGNGTGNNMDMLKVKTENSIDVEYIPYHGMEIKEDHDDYNKHDPLAMKTEENLNLEKYNSEYHGIDIKQDDNYRESDPLAYNSNQQGTKTLVDKVNKISTDKFKDKSEKNLAKNSKKHSLGQHNNFDQRIMRTSSTQTAEDIKDSDKHIPELDSSDRDVTGLQWEKPVKTVSDRKKMRTTCEIVLKHTTACPFRHHQSWFQCFFCTIDFIEFDALREHTLNNHGQDDVATLKRYPKMLQIDITVLDCKLCNVNLTDVKNMEKHFSEEHFMAVYKECIADFKLNSKPYTCHLCNNEYHVFRTLTVHLNEHYTNSVCDVCGKTFLNTKRLRVHKRIHEFGNFNCNICNKVLKTKSSKANHMETHTKRVLKCHLCFKTMKHYNDRIKHMSEVHDITNNFKCSLCGKDFTVKHYLTTHIRQYHGHKNKKCEDCGMAFVTNHGLKTHMLKHTGVKAFTCNVCNKSYARRYTLREHMRGHETEVKFAGT